MLSLLRRSAGDQIVEYMEIALAGRGARDPTPLEVVVECLDAAEATAIGELELSVLAEPGSIGVEERASVTEGLEDELGGRDLAGEFRALFAWVADTELEQRFDGESAVFGLATASLATKEGTYRSETVRDNRRRDITRR